MQEKNKIFIISGPSGAGEDSVIEGLKKNREFNRVVTTVTRKPRKGEGQGNPYFFITPDEFKEMIKKDEFIEWALVYGDYRGATKKEIERLSSLNDPVLWKVDWQGVKTIKKAIPEAVSIFITPESYEDLEKRIKERGENAEDTIKNRAQETKVWLEQKDIYDHTVVNKEGKLEETIKKVEEIIEKEL